MDPKPILVLGVNRSGTKWLSNEISRHPAVVAITHHDHGGIIESNLLTDYGKSFDFSSDDGYRSFLDFWVRTDFFIVAGASRKDFEPPNPRPGGSVEAFCALMNGVARARGAGYWLQKVSPFSTAHVLDRIPDAKLVMIRRNLHDTVRSRLKLDRDREFGTTAFRAAISIALQMRELEAVCRGRTVHVVDYERLRIEKEVVLAATFDFLGLDSTSVSEQGFPRNTSFANERERASQFGFRERLAVTTARLIVDTMPRFVLRRLRRSLTHARLEPLPGTFRQEEKRLSAGS